MNVRRAPFPLAVLLSGIALTACTPAFPTSPVARPPAFEHQGAKCSIAKSQSEPLVVDWSSVDRARLEALSRSGAVPVQYSGCEMKILSSCQLPDSSYRYVGTTRKHDEDHIKNADDLYAKLPLGAARLEGTLARAGELSVGMTIVGRYQLDRPVKKSDLVGECGEATHIISALTVGAFAFSAGARAKIAGEASAFGGSAGGSSESQRDVLTQDGSDSACDQAGPSDPQAPAGCGALIRVEVRVLPETAVQVASDANAREKERVEREEDEKSAGARRTAAYITGAAGLALVAGGLAAFAISSSAKSSIDGGELATGQDIVDADSRARTFQGFAIGGFVTGGIALAIGGILFFSSRSSAPPASNVGSAQ